MISSDTKTEVVIEARTARDVLIRQFDTRPLAQQWWSENAERFPGARLCETTTTTTVNVRRRDLTARANLRLVRTA